MRLATTANERLALILCGTAESRRARRDEAVELAATADHDDLLALFARLNVLTLAGARLLALEPNLAARVRDEIDRYTAWAGERGRLQEVVTLTALAELRRSGIPAMPLKGSALAHHLYGDPAFRVSQDIDVLVAPDDLPGAVDVLSRLGWRTETRSQPGVLPLLHDSLTHPSLPAIELHWRVHWYEDSFAADALQRATPGSASEPIRMQPSDELAALILFFARDGFAGLRTPADIASWPDATGLRDGLPARIAGIAERYPALAAPLRAGAGLLEKLVSLPSALDARPTWRDRAVLATANPFLRGDRTQQRADASFLDVVLAPDGARLEAVRRELRRYPHRRAAASRSSSLTTTLNATEHAARLARRWALTGRTASAAVVRKRPARLSS